MIDTTHYFIGFLIYTGFCLITFNTYSKIEDELTKKMGLFGIYIFYCLLAGYIINLVDIDGSGFEILVQTLVYFIAEGVFYGFILKIFLKEILNIDKLNIT